MTADPGDPNLRFTILTHDHPEWHWDLLLQQREQGLKSWRLAEIPASTTPICATAIPDHRELYLDYEGPISQGRGTVTQWDTGEYTAAAAGPEQWLISVHGRRLHGVIALQRLENDAWEYSYRPAAESRATES